MKLISVSTIPFVTFLIWIGLSHVNSLPDENSRISDGLKNGNLQSLGPTDGSSSHPLTPAPPTEINPSSSNSLQSTFFVTATPIGKPQYVYPESPTSSSSTTEVPILDEEDSQIAQPDFSPEQMDENPTEKEPVSPTEMPQQDPEDINSTRVPMEETTLQEVDDLINSNNDNLPNVSNDIDAGEGENDGNETELDIEDETEQPEPLPTPVALISANGEGSNPSIDEDFAEAFKRGASNNKRRRTRPSNGKKRVRMRVRKMNRLNGNSTEIPIDADTTPTLSFIEDETTTSPPTSTFKPRRFRSTTTPSPDPSPPTLSMSLPTFPAVVKVKNGPKPMIISDIHSGSTGINPVTTEPQLEKPTVGGFTEKISTYFITPPTKISTTKAPKVLANNDSNSNDTLDWSSTGDSTQGTNTLQENSNSYNSQRGVWGKNSFSGVSTERTEQSVVSPVVDINYNGNSNMTEENSDNSLQQPTMENRAYTLQDGSLHAQPQYETANNFGATATPSTRDRPGVFDSSFNFERDESRSSPGSNEPNGPQPDFLSRTPFNRFEENTPFVTNGQGSQFGSHYDRTKDAFGSANRFFKENSPFQGQEENNPSLGYPEHQLTGAGPTDESMNNAPLPVFDQNGYVNSATPSLDNQYFSQDLDIIPDVHFEPQRQSRFENEDVNNDYGKTTMYGDRFKGSPVDPTSNGPRGQKYPSTNQPQQGYLQNTFSYEDNKQPAAPTGFSHEGSISPVGQDEYAQDIQSEPPATIEYTGPLQNGPSTGEQFPQDIREVTLGYSQNVPDSPAQFSQNSQVTPDPSAAYPQNIPENGPTSTPGQPTDEQMFATIEKVPAYDVVQGNALHDSQRYPIFIAKSPGEPSRQPQFSPPKPIQFHHSPNFQRGNLPPPPPPGHPAYGHGPPGPGMHGGRFPSRPPMPNAQMYPPPNQNNHGPNPFNMQGGSRPPPDFQNIPNNVDLTIGLNNISPSPSEPQGFSEIQSSPHFPPHAHSMADKPDYEPANPPLPHGHPMENHFESLPMNGDESQPPQDGNNGQGQVASSNGDTQLITSPSLMQNDHSQGSNQPGYDIISAYYDKPPPTVGYYGNSPYGNSGNNPPSIQEVKNNDLYNVPFQYTSSDGGGLDGGYFHNPSQDTEHEDKPPKKDIPSHSEGSIQTETESGHSEPPPQQYKHTSSSNEEKNNKSSNVYSDTPYVLMFPQLVPEEAMVPPPPKMLTEEIPVVQASSLSSMTFTPDGKPALGPGLTTVPVHPRHQMYQVLAKAHYDQTMQKYMESKKRPPSAIYTPYGVLIPMGTSASASTNHEIYAKNSISHHPGHNSGHRKGPHSRQLLNFLLGKKTPFGHLHLNKGAAFKDGKLSKHFDLKANIDPALDLLAEKLAIKLSAVKHVLSAPAKLGVHAFSKHAASYSEHNPVVKEPSKKKGDSNNNDLLFSQDSETSPSNTKEGKVAAENNKELKIQLKTLLKERLKEIMEEVDAESMEHGSLSSRSGPVMMPMQSMMVSTKVPPPGNSNRWTNYFSSSNNNQHSGGLIGTIKRLFSFGGNDNDNNMRSDGFSSLSTRFSSNSTHPFGWYGGSLSALNSIGRMGVNSIQLANNEQMMPMASGWNPEKKAKKQLEKWLDVVLKSSDSSKSGSTQDPSTTEKLSLKQVESMRRGRNFPQGKDSLSSASSSSAIKDKIPSKMSNEVSSSPKNEDAQLGKRLGQPAPTGSPSKTKTFLPQSWKPMVSAFRSVFNYSPGKPPTVLKPKPT